jgi:RHS repeat-associated protein
MKKKVNFLQRISYKSPFFFLPLLLLLAFSAIGSFLLFKNFQSNKLAQEPKPVAITIKGNQVAVARQLVTAKDGGELKVNQTIVSFPENFSQKDLVTSYRAINSKKLIANNQIGSMFELKARTQDGQDVSQFDKPLEIKTQLTDADLKGKDPKSFALYFFNTKTNAWEKLASRYDSETKQLIASSTHFTTFVPASSDPNQGISQPAGQSFIIDDSDPSPGFIFDGDGDDTQPSFLGQSGVGYNAGSTYTGNSIDTKPRNWGIWTATNLNGTVEVKALIPAIGIPLTKGATYTVTDSTGDHAVVIDQAAAAGSVVSLGTYTFTGTGSVKLIDVVPANERTKFFNTHIVFDAVSFGEEFGNLDLIPPRIENVKAQNTPNGKFVIEAKVTDAESGVASVYLYYDPDTTDGVPGQTYPMNAKGDIYSLSNLPSINGKPFDYAIIAYDNAGNEAIKGKDRGYVTRTNFASQIGFYKGSRGIGGQLMAGAMCGQTVNGVPSTQVQGTKQSCSTQQNGQWNGDPVDTLTGNFIEQQKLLTVGGRPNIDFFITHNAQGGQESIFGENWTHSYNFHLVEMDNADFQGVFIQYPDGKVLTFTGPDLKPAAGYYETLVKVGGGYELTFTDLTKIKFDQDGEIVRWEDANGNGLTFSYGAKNTFTLLSQITSIKADGGREITLSYNSDGLVDKISAPEGKTLQFGYDQDDLTSFTDGNGSPTRYEYSNHRITKKISPKGHPYYVNTYDDQGRVLTQVSGTSFANTYAYSANETKVTDANNNLTTYHYNSDGLLTELTDAKGKSEKYEYSPEKELSKFTDRENNKYEYTYDAKGNRTKEKDPQDLEITRTFDTTFNKPTQEVFKQADHITQWEYDSKGNLKKRTNAEGAIQTFEYNSFGQLTQETDLNSHPTKYTYTPQGDRETITDAESNVQTLSYDGLGRLVKATNPHQAAFTYIYDGNDNLKETHGPLGYTLKDEFDPNNHIIKHTDADLGTIEFTYDASENLVETKNQLGFKTTFTYGPMNEKLTETSPEGQVIQYAYDPTYLVKEKNLAVGTPTAITFKYEYNYIGDLVKTTDPVGKVTAYTYDSLHHLTQKIDNAVLIGLNPSEQNIKTTFTYGPTGAVTKITDPNQNTTEYTLDKLDRVLSAKDAEGQITQQSYDGEDHVISSKDARGNLTSYEFNNLNLLKKVTDAKSGETTYSYDPNNNLEIIKDPNGVSTKYTYDLLDRRTQRVDNYIANAATNETTNVTTGYTYDLYGNLTQVKNPRGYITQFKYDAAHRNTMITDANGNAANLTYDKVDRLTELADRNNHSQKTQYDALNRVTKTIDPENYSEQFSYDKVGNVISYVDARGTEFKKEYDPINRVKTAIDPYNNTKKYSYDAVGNLLALTDENNHTGKFEYDKVYRLRKSTDAEGNTTEQQFDQNGNIVKLIDGEGNPTTFSYDELDRVIAKTNAEGETEKYSYDKTANLTTKTEADNTVHQYTYDQLYRLSQVANNYKANQSSTNDTNVTTKYQYDANGNLVAAIDPLSHTSKYEFDSLDRLHKETDPLSNSWTYSYDNEKNVTERVDANGAKTTFKYYPDNQLNTVTYPDHSVSYEYNPDNKPTKMVDNLGSTTWEYDLLNRVTKQVDPLNRTIGYTYDAVGNIKGLKYPDGRAMQHEYLKNDWLAKSASTDTDAITYTRNKVGIATKVERTNSSVSNVSYDKVYRPTQVYDQQIGSGNHLISKFNYTYNKVGHITQDVSAYGWRQPDQVTTKYGYDGLHRLTDASSDDAQSSKYTYDAAGNRTTLIEQLKKGPETHTYTYNDANQIVASNVTSPTPPDVVKDAYQYDKNGNRINHLVTDKTGVDRGIAYKYDFENRLTQAQDYQVGGNSTQPVPTPTPSPSPSTTPSPSLNPSPSVSPTPSASPCLKGNGKNDGKDLSKDCNNGTGNDGKTLASASTSLSPSPSSSAQPSISPSPALASPTPQPTPASQTPSATATDPNFKAHTDFAYDGNGRRLISTYYAGSSDSGKRTEYTYDRLDPIAEYSMWNNQRQNLYRDSNQNLAFYQEFKSEQSPSGTLYWFHYDGKGNIAATTKHQAQSDHTYRYDEYGSILPQTNGSANWTAPHNQYTLTQKEYDGNANLFYFGARYYDPNTGTWLTQDNYRGQQMEPMSRHRYMYNNSSPINYRDFYGNCSDPSLIAQGCASWMGDGVFTAQRNFRQGVSDIGQAITAPVQQLIEIKANESVFGQPMTNAQRDQMIAQNQYLAEATLQQKAKQGLEAAIAANDCTRIASMNRLLDSTYDRKAQLTNEYIDAGGRMQLDNQRIQLASQVYYYIPAIGAGYAIANAWQGQNSFTGQQLSAQDRAGEVVKGLLNYGATVGAVYGTQVAISSLSSGGTAITATQAGQGGTVVTTIGALCGGDCSDETEYVLERSSNYRQTFIKLAEDVPEGFHIDHRLPIQIGQSNPTGAIEALDILGTNNINDPSLLQAIEANINTGALRVEWSNFASQNPNASGTQIVNFLQEMGNKYPGIRLPGAP